MTISSVIAYPGTQAKHVRQRSTYANHIRVKIVVNVFIRSTIFSVDVPKTLLVKGVRLTLECADLNLAKTGVNAPTCPTIMCVLANQISLAVIAKMM